MSLSLSLSLCHSYCLCHLLYKYAIICTLGDAHCVRPGERCRRRHSRHCIVPAACCNSQHMNFVYISLSAVLLSSLLFSSFFLQLFHAKGHCGVATFDSNDCNYYGPQKKKRTTTATEFTMYIFFHSLSAE